MPPPTQLPRSFTVTADISPKEAAQIMMRGNHFGLAFAQSKEVFERDITRFADALKRKISAPVRAPATSDKSKQGNILLILFMSIFILGYFPQIILCLSITAIHLSNFLQ